MIIIKKRMVIDVFVTIGLQSLYGVKHEEWWARHDDSGYPLRKAIKKRVQDSKGHDNMM